MTIDISRIDRNSLDLAIKDALVAAKECHSHRKYLNDNNRLGWCCHTYFMKIPTNITIKYLTEKMAYEIAVSRRPTLSPWILGGQEICPWTKLTALKHFCQGKRYIYKLSRYDGNREGLSDVQDITDEQYEEWLEPLAKYFYIKDHPCI